MNFDFKEYRNHILRKYRIDGIRLIWECEMHPVEAGEKIYNALKDLYPNIVEACFAFKVPMPVYKSETRALWKYLESIGIRKEDDTNGQGSNWQDNGNLRGSER